MFRMKLGLIKSPRFFGGDVLKGFPDQSHPDFNNPKLSHANLQVERNTNSSFVKSLFSPPLNLHRYKIFRKVIAHFGQASAESSIYHKTYPGITENSINIYHGNEELSFNIYA